MKIVSALNWYLVANVLVAMAALQIRVLMSGSRSLLRGLRFGQLLRIAYLLTIVAVVLPAFDLGTGLDVLPPTAQVWSAESSREVPAAAELDRVAVAVAATEYSLSLGNVARFILIFGVLGLAVVAGQLLRDGLATVRIIGASQVIRRHGRVAIVSADSVSVPFSFWTVRHAWIVLPSSLVGRSRELRIAIGHEAQHHRQGDTRMLYLYQLLRGLFFWNPAVHGLARQVRELQELACDEAMTRRRTSALEYCRCLLAIASESFSRPSLLHARMSGQGSMRRRLNAILDRTPSRGAALIGGAIGTVTVGMLVATSLAVAAPIHDRRITMEEAQQMAVDANMRSSIPLVVNDAVLYELNLMLGTPDGRAAMQAAAHRMTEHRDFIAQQLAHYNLPQELLAVPLVESGYRNLRAGPDRRHGAGLWMFIESTARHFGLTVNAQRDDRLDVAAETEAAMLMFASLHARFNDWGLALLAYNSGSRRVTRGIRETSAIDAWQLIERGYENDPNYVPRVMAAILVLENPSLLD